MDLYKESHEKIVKAKLIAKGFQDIEASNITSDSFCVLRKAL